MRFQTAAVALLSAPSLVSAAGKLGFSLGAKNPDGACKLTADYEADFDAIAAETDSKIVRVYAAGQCDTAANILPAAKTKGFQVVLGVWPDTEDSYQLDKAAILAHAPGYYDQVWAITVGSESLYRGTFTGDQLVDKIHDLRAAAPQFWYGTADSWNKFQDGTADPVIKASDILLVNAFPYWQGDTVADSWATLTTDTDQAWDRIVSVVGNNPLPEVWIGETGWPSEGTKYQNAEPGLQNAETFYHENICGKINGNWNTFAFEAFDEPWKPLSTGDDGSQADETHWGVMYADRSPKYSLRC